MDNIVEEIKTEVNRALGSLPEGYEDKNTDNDYIAYINAYTGRAARGVLRNERDEQDFRSNMIKAAGLCISAIVAHDKR